MQITLHKTRAIYFLRKLSVVEQDMKAEVTHKAREQLKKKKEMYTKRIDEKLRKIMDLQHKLSEIQSHHQHIELTATKLRNLESQTNQIKQSSVH